MGILILLVVALFGILQVSAVQTYIAQKLAKNLSKELGTRVGIDRVDISFFHSVKLNNLIIYEQKSFGGDTIASIGKIEADFNNLFFLKDSLILRNVNADNIIVKTRRTNDKWNYDFIVDYFGSGKKSKSETKSNFIIRPRNVELSRIRFQQTDGWLGENLTFTSGKIKAIFQTFDLSKQRVSLTDLSVQKPSLSYYEYDGNPLRQKKSPQKEVIEYQGTSPWYIALSKFVCSDGDFQYDKKTIRKAYQGEFDPLHFGFDQLNTTMSNLLYCGDSLQCELKLSTRERCGFEIKQLKSIAIVSSRKMEFKDLFIETNKSKIGDYYAMHYESFQKDMSDYVNKVRMSGKLNNCRVHTDDIAFFAPAIRRFNREVNVNGDVDGIVEDLRGENISLQSGQSGYKGSFAITSSTNIDKIKLQFASSEAKTNASEIVNFYPYISKQTFSTLKKFGNLSYKGTFESNLKTNLINGSLNTDLGNLNGKFTINPDAFKGELQTDGFYAGIIIENKKLGRISGKSTLSGNFNKGISLNVSVNKLPWDGYEYRNISASGIYSNEKFEGQMESRDPNLKFSNWIGSIQVNGPMKLNFNAMVEHADLKALGITPNSVNIKGNININTEGLIPDEFTGEIEMRNASIESNNKDTIEFKKLTLNSFISQSGNKKLTLTSDQLDAGLEGRYVLSNFKDLLLSTLHFYYPGSFEKPLENNNTADFTFYINTHQESPILSLINPKITESGNFRISGFLNNQKKTLHVSGKVPWITYDEKKFNNIRIEEKGDSVALSSNIQIDQISITDSIEIPSVQLHVLSANDSSIIQLKTGLDNTIHQAELNASFQKFNNGFKLHFYPSSFYLNDKKWALETDGELSVRNNQVFANDIRFYQDSQSLKITTELDDENDKQRIIALFENIKINDFASIAIKNPLLDGFISGKAIITDPFGEMKAETNIKASAFKINDQKIGNINIKSDYDRSTGLLSYLAISDDTASLLKTNGIVNLSNSSNRTIHSTFEAKSIDLSILTPILSDIFDDINGKASTSFDIDGDLSSPDISGSVLVKQAALKVGFTKCRYFLENQQIQLDKDKIKFGYISIHDSLSNTGTLSGDVLHNKFNNISFNNLKVSSSKIVFLNTNNRDNDHFYGRASGKASVSINGPLSNLQINIEAEPSLLDTSHIYIAGGESKESNKVDYIEFMNLKQIQPGTKSLSKNNIVVNIIARANPSCKVDVILDEVTGDVIKGEGSGNLNISLGTTLPLSIQGNYELTKGEYTFNFQTFLKKPFTLNKGSINWNGDPYNANIDVFAEYLAKNVDVSSITSAGGFQNKQDIKILSRLTGILKNPTVKFDFELPEGSSLRRDEVVVKRLADFKNDDNEMNKQVASLLLFNTFLTANANFISQGNANILISNTIGGAVSSLLTNMLNRELEKATRGILTTYIDINPTLDLQRSLTQLQANIRAGLKISLSNRLIVLLGGNLDYNNPLYAQQLEKRGLLTPDITIEWIINRDGTMRVVGFNRTSMDLALNQRKQSGLQLSYRKDVDNILDIFRSKQ